MLTGALSKVVQPAIDEIITHPKPNSLIIIPATIVALALGRSLFQVIQATAINRMGNGVIADAQIRLFSKLVRSDLNRLRGAHSGSYVSSVLYDAGLIREAATSGVVNYTREFLTVIAQLVVMFQLDPILAAGVLVIAPAASLVIRWFSRETSRAAKGAMGETSNLSTAIMESLDGIKIVKIENREAYEEARVSEVVDRRQRHLVKGSNARAMSAPTIEAFTTLLVAAVFVYAGWRASSGGITAGGFFSFLTALLAAAQSLRQVANLQTVFSEGFTAARRLFEVLDVEPTIVDRPGAQALPAGEATIVFDKVSFAYGQDAPALHEVSLEARRGETIALVGPSGGGKSTLLSLLPRFYDVTGGAITINGLDLRQLKTQCRGVLHLLLELGFSFGK